MAGRRIHPSLLVCQRDTPQVSRAAAAMRFVILQRPKYRAVQYNLNSTSTGKQPADRLHKPRTRGA